MTKIEYIISNKDVRDGYYYMLKNSTALRQKVTVYTLLIMAIPIIMGLALHGAITTTLFILAIFFGFFYAFFLPWLSSIVREKGEKTVELSREGMSISISNKHKIIPWSWVEEIKSNKQFLFILGKSGNFLCVPNAAFNDISDLENFISNIASYKNA